MKGYKGFSIRKYLLIILVIFTPLVSLSQEVPDATLEDVAGSDTAAPAFTVEAPAEEAVEQHDDGQSPVPVVLPETVLEAAPEAEAGEPLAGSETRESSGFIQIVEKAVGPAPFSTDEATLNRIYDIQLDNGIDNFTSFAAFLIVESYKATKAGNHTGAIRLALAARQMAPNLPHAYWALGKAYWGESKARVFTVIGLWFKGWSVGCGNFRTVVLVLSNFFFIVHLAFFLTIIAFSCISVCKYYRLFAYDIGGIISGQQSAFVGHIWAVSIILLPILIGLGPLLVALFWLLICALYFSRREKQVVWAVFLLLLLLPLSFRNAASLILAQQEGVLSSVYRANNEEWLSDTEEDLRTWFADHPQDKDVLFSLALLKKKQGAYNEAGTLYRDVLAFDPKDAAVMGNLANVYLGKGRLKKAEEVYQRAIEIDGSLASLHYNLYRTYLELYKFLEAQQRQELQIARSLNPDMIDYQESIFKHGVVNRMVIDEKLPFREFWDKAFFYSEAREELAASLWSLFMTSLPIQYALFVFIALCFTVSFLFFQSSQRRFSVSCAKCGRPLSKVRTAHTVEIPNICANCVSLFVDFKKVDLKTKQSREKQVAGYEKRSDVIMSIVTFCLPGGGFLWSGAPWRGALCVLIFFLFVMKVCFWNGIIHDPMALAVETSYAPMVLFGVLFLLFYWVSVTLSYGYRDSLPNCIEEFRSLRGKDEGSKEKTREPTRPGTSPGFDPEGMVP